MDINGSKMFEVSTFPSLGTVWLFPETTCTVATDPAASHLFPSLPLPPSIVADVEHGEETDGQHPGASITSM